MLMPFSVATVRIQWEISRRSLPKFRKVIGLFFSRSVVFGDGAGPSFATNGLSFVGSVNTSSAMLRGSHHSRAWLTVCAMRPAKCDVMVDFD